MFEFFITKPLGFIIQFIYNIVQNYGWSIVIFTVVVKLILLPLQIKSQKSMKKQQKIQPIIAQLQNKYANDKEKLQTEMMKVYKENNVSMTGGCLPLLIQFPILIGLYNVIQRPLSYLLNVDFKLESVIERISDVIAKMAADPAVAHAVEGLKNLDAASLAEKIHKTYQIQFLTWTRYLEETVGGFSDWVLNFNFLGLDLSKKPSAGVSALFSGNFENLSTILLLLIPAVAVFATWFSMRQSQKMTSAKKSDDMGDTAATMNSMSKTMNYMMPVMTGVFTFTLPAAMGVYWITSSIMQIVTQYILNVYLDKKEDDFVVKIPEKNRKNSKKHR
ncbi:MAG: YidC/Oxa1 family membrane protein insertase [Eubacteriales bacterium]|nr:YidC/Oxa1 family membrane protein insertase [Eubacteriales bacterium]